MCTAKRRLEAIARGVIADQDALLDKICEMTLPKAAASAVSSS